MHLYTHTHPPAQICCIPTHEDNIFSHTECTHAHIHTFRNTHMHIHTHIYNDTRTQTHINIQTKAHILTLAQMCTQTHMCTLTHTCMHSPSHARTHTPQHENTRHTHSWATDAVLKTHPLVYSGR